MGQGDIVSVLYQRTGVVTPITFACINGMPNTLANVCFAVGLSMNAPLLDSTVVATGVATYNAQNTLATAGLPDIWWRQTIRISMAVTTGTIGAIVYIVERDDGRA